MEYLSGDKKFSLSYSELKGYYNDFCDMSDSEFLENIHNALHLACVICFLKEVPTSVCLTDTGIIHELVHLSGGEIDPIIDISEIRDLFKTNLKLV